MPPRLLLAPAGHGKTEYLIQRIRRILSDEPLAPVLVIVPNAIQAAGFRQRLVAAGGALGVEVHTFYTLYAELLARSGQPMPLLTDPVRIRLLRAIVNDLCERGNIQHYAALRDRPGFIALLRNGIEELKRARIFPEDFIAASRNLLPRLSEVALVYNEYQEWLQRNNWADNDGRGWLSAIALESSPELLSEARFLAVSGFDEFNPTQLAVLSLLAKRATETIITLTGDLERPRRPAQRRFQRAQKAIVSSLGIEPEMMDSTTMLMPAIARIEASLFENVIAPLHFGGFANEEKQSSIKLERSTDKHQTHNRGLPRLEEHHPRNDIEQVEFIESQTRTTEVRAALRWLKARVVRDGMALADVAVLARDIKPYRPFLEETADEFGIPLRILGGWPLIENAAVAALLSLLSIPNEEWPRRLVLDAWRNPYFDWSEPGITPEDVTELDEISRQGHVISGLEQWYEAFEIWKNRKITEFEDDLGSADAKDSKLVNIQRLESMESRFQRFVDLLTIPVHATVKQFIAFVENLMGDDPALTSAQPEDGGIHVVACARASRLTEERDVAALRAFKDVLRGLALAEATLQSASLDYAEFYADLRVAVESATYSVPGQSGMLAASVMDGRGLAFQAVALMGLSQGEFPRLEREDVLFSESDRETLRTRGLSLETRLHGDEGSLFYQAATRARQKLLLTRPYLADDGQPWEPSPFWDEMYRLNGSRPVVRVRPEDSLTELAEAASSIEWRETAREFDIHMERGMQTLMARLAPTAEGAYEGDTSIDSVLVLNLNERFGPGHGWSASRLESYGTCPYEFFVAYALKLEPRTPPEEGFDVRMLGSMLHKILEDVYSSASDLETCLALLPEKALAVFERAPQEYGFRPTALWTLQQQELERRLREMIIALDEVSREFTPLHMEARFGMGQPSLVLQTEAGEVRLHGYIDRLDAAPDGSLRVIDYKSGGTTISGAHLKEGRRLQLPIYALAAQEALGLGKVSSGFYWHIQSAKASSLKLEKFEGGVNAAFAMAVSHIGEHVKNIRAGHFEPKPPAEGCPSYCPAVGFCWRYKKGF
ncbi:MAG: PD-(D/E)XK nuclease family protein [Anaerolineales bacterium]|jgi:ATP-dependent helicase/DNAse subunit B